MGCVSSLVSTRTIPVSLFPIRRRSFPATSRAPGAGSAFPVAAVRSAGRLRTTAWRARGSLHRSPPGPGSRPPLARVVRAARVRRLPAGDRRWSALFVAVVPARVTTHRRRPRGRFWRRSDVTGSRFHHTAPIVTVVAAGRSASTPGVPRRVRPGAGASGRSRSARPAVGRSACTAKLCRRSYGQMLWMFSRVHTRSNFPRTCRAFSHFSSSNSRSASRACGSRGIPRSPAPPPSHSVVRPGVLLCQGFVVPIQPPFRRCGRISSLCCRSALHAYVRLPSDVDRFGLQQPLFLCLRGPQLSGSTQTAQHNTNTPTVTVER